MMDEGKGPMQRNTSFHASPAERERILNVVCETLGGQPDVGFAYAHGSVLTGRPFHDVDVAVYLDAVDAGCASERGMALGAVVQDALLHASDLPARPPVDVRALNFAPLGFCYHVLLHGRLLVSRDEALRIRWAVGVAARYLDLLPLRRHALKEAMKAWGST
jgi:predicted nucleotidyltransferase